MRFLRAFVFDRPTTLPPFSFSVVNIERTPSQLALAQVSTMLMPFEATFTLLVERCPNVGAGIDGTTGAGGGGGGGGGASRPHDAPGEPPTSTAPMSDASAPAAVEFAVPDWSIGRVKPRW